MTRELMTYSIKYQTYFTVGHKPQFIKIKMFFFSFQIYYILCKGTVTITSNRDTDLISLEPNTFFWDYISQ